MPNTACLVHAGATVIAPGKAVRKGDASLVQKLFQTVGLCYVGSEDHLDAVTGLSGSGPAYVSILYTDVIMSFNAQSKTIFRFYR